MPEPQTTGPTTTIEGAVTNVVALGCGTAATAAMKKDETVTNATPTSLPGSTMTGSMSAAAPQSNGHGCSAALLITPGVNWAQVVHNELVPQGETAGGLAGFGVPVTVVVASNAKLTTRDGADISLQDLTKGSIVKVDYTVHNDVPIATNIDVTWHAGQ